MKLMLQVAGGILLAGILSGIFWLGAAGAFVAGMPKVLPTPKIIYVPAPSPAATKPAPSLANCYGQDPHRCSITKGDGTPIQNR